MRGRWVRITPWCSTAGAAVFALLALGCSRTLPHEFDARTARDYIAPRVPTARDAVESAILAVLLVPMNTTVVRYEPPSRLGIGDNITNERYVGPARVFLPPGERRYKVRVQTVDDVFELALDAEFEPGKRYELVILEDGKHVAFELFELHPSSYATLYPRD